MDTSKKNDAGHVVVWMSLDGVSKEVSSDISVKIVQFFLPPPISPFHWLTGLYGLKNGLLADRR